MNTVRPKGNQKHLDLSARIIIEQHLNNGDSFRSIAIELSKDPSLSLIHISDTYELMQIYELRERLIVCQAVIAHLAARKETRWHRFGENTDYPQQSDEWMKYVNSRMENGEIKILYRDLITKENTGLNTAEKGAGER